MIRFGFSIRTKMGQRVENIQIMAANRRSSRWSGPNSFTSIGLLAPLRSFSSSAMIWMSSILSWCSA